MPSTLLAASTRNEVFDPRHTSRQRCRQPGHTVWCNEHVILDPDANSFVFFKRRRDSRDEFLVLRCLRKIIERVSTHVFTRLICENHTRLRPCTVVAALVDIHSERI